MTTRAYAEFNHHKFGVRIAVIRAENDTDTVHLTWGAPTVTVTPHGTKPGEESWLQLDDEDARAIYEALADYGHSGHDTRALRKDYDAERKRVDSLILGLIGVIRG